MPLLLGVAGGTVEDVLTEAAAGGTTGELPCLTLGGHMPLEGVTLEVVAAAAAAVTVGVATHGPLLKLVDIREGVGGAEAAGLLSMTMTIAME